MLEKLFMERALKIKGLADYLKSLTPEEREKVIKFLRMHELIHKLLKHTPKVTP